MTEMISHPKMEEIDQVLAFMNACDTAEFGQPDSDMEDLQEQWSESDLEKDAWITRDNDAISGYACVSPGQNRISIDLYVHQSLSPVGVGAKLIGLCENRAREMMAGTSEQKSALLVGYASRINDEAVSAFEQNGFVAQTFQFRMQIDLDHPFEDPTFPDGYCLQPFHDGDEQALYDLVQCTFTWTGHVTTPFNEWHNALFRSGRFDPECFVTLWHGEQLAGAALSYDEGTRGWIRQLAIAKEYQGKGLGSRLLKHMFAFYQQRGAASVALGVASQNAKAGEFYEHCGMHKSREFIEFHKDI
jgi:GNAT superfamily N-acetyltransferase